MKALWKIGVAVFATMTLSVASQAQVSVDVDQNVNLKQFKSYAWLSPDIKVGPNPLYNSGLISNHVKHDVDVELAKKGLAYDEQQPDLLVSFHTYTEARKEQVPNAPIATPYLAPTLLRFPRGFVSGWAYMPWGYANWPYQWNAGFRTVNYTEGTLIVDVVDAHTQQLIWRGVAQGQVNSTSNGINRELHTGIHRMFKKYPSIS